jgi:3-phenylpropionate/trans-cinnamate dioxygenase ferredoxin reductase subunit
MTDGLIIVGGSYAAAQIAVTARQKGYEAPICMISEEATAPYQRPPLSKAYLAESGAENVLPIRADVFYQEQKIDVRLRTRVVEIDRAAHNVRLDNGQRVPYGKLALAVGARARTLDMSGAELDGVFTLRTLADARRIKAALAGAQNVVVIGGGFIGLEVASVAVKLGKNVRLLEALERPLGRACPPIVADWITDLHRQRGVQTQFGAKISSLGGEGGRVRAVVLDGGTEYQADVVIIGVGAVPNVELAEASGLMCNNGIVVDRYARTSDPDIVAAGDCTRFPSDHAELPVRLESVQNATDQARVAASTIVGHEEPYTAVPWFWSDQYDVKLQMVGLSQGHEAYAVRGEMGGGRFSVYYFSRGRLIAVDSVNRPADHMLARRLVAQRASFSNQQASDESFDLKSLLT